MFACGGRTTPQRHTGDIPGEFSKWVGKTACNCALITFLHISVTFQVCSLSQQMALLPWTVCHLKWASKIPWYWFHTSVEATWMFCLSYSSIMTMIFTPVKTFTLVWAFIGWKMRHTATAVTHKWSSKFRIWVLSGLHTTFFFYISVFWPQRHGCNRQRSSLYSM